MNRNFATIGIKLATNIFEDTTASSSTVQKVAQFSEISPVQIHNLVMQSTNGKATGFDLVSNRLFKVASLATSSQIGSNSKSMY